MGEDDLLVGQGKLHEEFNWVIGLPVVGHHEFSVVGGPTFSSLAEVVLLVKIPRFSGSEGCWIGNDGRHSSGHWTFFSGCAG